MVNVLARSVLQSRARVSRCDGAPSLSENAASAVVAEIVLINKADAPSRTSRIAGREGGIRNLGSCDLDDV